MKLYGYVVRDNDTGKCFNGDLGDMGDHSLWVYDIADATPLFESEAQVAYDIAKEYGINAELVDVELDCIITESTSS